MNKNPFQVKLAETLGKFGSVDLDNVKVHLDKNNIIPVYLPKIVDVDQVVFVSEIEKLKEEAMKEKQ